ncbi:5'-3' exoribonuclease 1 isoform X3 [Rattus norvegicus]|uniref:5'-3' exoribonuclease 1 isoform X3 n=1 Tax=Rattus norvegicus TaxID=10116 RepID=UPI0003D083BA|nr:5'-3' exoribonuclease 1 isoform X3 [Rattus norvegicus]|eukprot:XP_006243658.1 PREDICTED: 5'-3' exoribonuclease 1 isoform X2 [Rattus norvegicus]
MGVPKFYRWISERYPCLSEVVKEHQIPEFDNLYLDMNGIIHQCSHPNDDDVHFRISDDKIFTDIFHYLEVLFRIIKPRKVFFMAVDGVAPRAKMNQQRGRRFRSAKEAEDKIKKAIEKGETLPTEARFDSNCITPGTEFMARLHEHLKYFVNMKISTDKSWQGVTIYFSGHETPGEGEHKIMEFIRSEKAKPDHDPNTRHCLYGLDADLIMLGLTSHEAHFSLLREEVRFGGKKTQRVCAPEETTFHLLHLSLMREYIDYEFSALKEKITFKYDIEKIIDDWILMGFLVGNDFIPHLPHLHINHDALPLLYGTYIAILPELGGYINESGHLNLPRFERYLVKLSDFDREHFSEVFVDLKWFESKVGNKYLNEAAGAAAEEAKSCKDKRKVKGQENSLSWAALDKREGEGVASRDNFEDETEDDDLFETEFRQYKRTYYMTKMGVDVVSDEFLADQAACYVQAIQWILHYYYHGVQSWSWYYPYHYAPFLSDIRNISTLKIHFELGKPFKPFEQLLAVLPSASKTLLPTCYQHLMTSEDSPIIEYYPPDFKTDLNGKQQEWEAVVLIPFIDEKRLLEAMETCNHSLKKEERKRNQHSECLMCWYDSDTEFTYSSPWPEKFPAIERCSTRYKIISLDAWRVDINKNKITRVDQKALYFCGFPTLKHIKHKFFLKKSGVQVFQQSSRGENMMLEITVNAEPDELSIENIASSVLGKSVFVNWPHLEEARVVAVSDGETKFYMEEPPGTQKVYLGKTAPPCKVIQLSDKEQSNWTKEIQGISEQYLRRKGIMINETSAVVYAQLLTGRRYQVNQNGEVRLEKQWSKQSLPFVYQTIVKDVRAFDSRFSNIKTLDDLFPPRSVVFMLGTPYYGCTGEVQDSGDVITEGRIRVVFSIPCEPNLDALIQNQHKYSIKYNPGYVLAGRLGVSGYLVSRFTGSIFIGRGSRRNPHGDHKANVGLNLKFNKKNEEVPGYTKRVGSEWMYSSAAEQLLAEYIERAPELFSYIAQNSQEDVFYEDDIWPGESESGAEKVQEIITWLKGHPVSTLSRSSCDLHILDAAIVEKIEEEVEKCKQRKNNKKVRVTVKPHLLFRPLEQQHGAIPDRDAEFRLFDRVVNVRENFSVPVGLRGTIIGIKGANREADVLFEVLFDEEFPGGLTIRCSPGRGYRLPTSALVNLSHGSRCETGNQKLTAIVKPQPAVSHCSVNSSVSSGHMGGLNHSPQSLFLPTQVPTKGDDEFCNIWQSLQGSGKIQHLQPTVQEKNFNFQGAVLPQEISQVTESHKSGFNDHSVRHQQRKHDPHRKFKEEYKSPKAECQNQKLSNKQTSGASARCNIKLLKRNESPGTSEAQKVVTSYPNAVHKPHSGIESFLASLNISKESEVQLPHGEPPDEAHLSPQSFAMKGTRMLKEILKIDSPDTTDSKNDVKKFDNEVMVSSSRRDEHGPSSHPKPTSHVSQPHSTNEYQSVDSVCWPGHMPPVSTPVTELSRICSLVGMPQPDFSFLRTTQTMTVCQVKLSNGLLVHGPQCHSESEAKERAALFALQQLGSLGVNFPLPPPIFTNYPPAVPPGAVPPVFPQPTANMMPSSSHLFGSVPWRPPVPVPGNAYHYPSYPATMPLAGGMPGGVHNQFIPLQVTKKRVANKKNFENKEAQSSQATPLQTNKPGSSEATRMTPQEGSPASSASSQATQPVSSHVETASQGHVVSHQRSAPSSSRRKSRKLAVNFSVSKPSE